MTTPLFCTDDRNGVADERAAIADAVAFQVAVATENRALLEQLAAKGVPLDPTLEFHSRADRITLEMRRILRELVELAGAPCNTPISAPARRPDDRRDLMNPAELVERFHRELWGAADPGALDRYVAPDATTEMTGFDGNTVEIMRADVERYFGAFSDVTTEILELFGSGEQAVLLWRTAGTHTGPYGDIAPEPTGRVIVMEGVDIFRVADDRIVAVRSFWDAAAVYRQFGLLADGL